MAAAGTLYDTKTSAYFRYVRSEIIPLLPARADRVLEIGCGTGMTLAHLRATGRATWTYGIEIVESAAREAAAHLDRARHADVEREELDVPDGSLDLVLALDVLEHLVDPWSVVRKLERALKPGGKLITSLPNVRHHSVVVPLLVRGEWEYLSQGQLDRTHLRFFTKKTGVALLESSGMRVDRIDTVMSGRSRLLAKWTASLVAPFLEYQYLLRAVKA